MPSPAPSLGEDSAPDGPSPRLTAYLILALTLVAAVLRLVALDRSPPGLNQDEAINAWNAFSLVRTGADMVGARWPLFYFHSIGDNRTPLFIYWLVPFVAVGGLDVVAIRAAAAIGGVLCVPLAYAVGAKLFGRRVGLIAAALLVANPWHLSSTRWAIDGTIVPLVSLVTIAAMRWAGLPISDGKPGRIRPVRAALAGAVAGIGCYGYWAIRLQFPLFLAIAVLATLPAWRERMRSRAGARSIAAFAIGLLATAGPLALEHVRDPAIGVRGAMTRLWDAGTPAAERIRRVGARYVEHFGPEFLFVRGDREPGNAPADSGAFEWATLPLFLAGIYRVGRNARRSVSHAFLLAMVLAYPLGDVAARYPGVHAFRSSPGMAGLVLLAAAGGEWIWLASRRRSRTLALGAAATIAVAAWAQDARSLWTYFHDWRERPRVYFNFHEDVMKACRWLQPRLKSTDQVLWTASYVNSPFAMTLVGLRYDPARWASDPKDVRVNEAGWDYYVRYGSHYFLYDPAIRPYVDSLQANGRPDHAWIVVRPGEFGMKNPVHVVRGPTGEEVFWICEGQL